ncbi:TIGR02996 domain-containing protein [Myxococcus stipitatus]|uniref:TIGR02996 domain-containing protein n=1 Tax=Myxococcus stipitatus TaxID=83455 RepID=UPI0030CCFD5A
MSRSKAVSNPELEAAILQDPDAVDAYLVYGDWLQSHGDPRGELISLHHAWARAHGLEAKSFEQQAHEFLQRHEPRLVGDVLAQALRNKHLELDWDLGFIRAARVCPDSPAEEETARRIVRELIRHPSARFLRALSVGGIATFGFIDRYDGITRLIVRAGGSRTLQTLALRARRHNGADDYPSIQIGDVAPLYAVLPRLRSLDLRGAHARLGDIDLPELREFTLETHNLSRPCLDSILSAKWPKLEQLTVWLGGTNTGAEWSVEDIHPLLDGDGLPNLRGLGLCGTRFTDTLVHALHDSRVLPRLTHLDLSGGTLSNQGAQWLSEHAEAFQHLQHLDLRGNMMTDVGMARVAALCLSVDAQEQHNR